MDRAAAARELTRAAADCRRDAGASFSFGLASMASGWTPRAVLQAADVELYQAKGSAAHRRGGRPSSRPAGAAHPDATPPTVLGA
jgi:hypothetical protein